MKERLREKLNERLELARRIQSGDYTVHQQAAQKAKNWPLYMGATTGVLFLIAFLTKSELATLLAFIIGGVTFVMVSTVGKLKLAGQAPILKEILGGTIIKPATEPTEGEGIPVGMLKMPERCETLHTLIEGGTGAGKTQVLKQMVAAIRERGDALVVIDTGYDMHKTFGQPGDIVLSPFDPASPGWSPENEVQVSTDWNALAESLIGSDPEKGGKEWDAMARAFFAAVARSYHRQVLAAGEDFNLADLFHLLTAAPPDVLEPFLQGTAVASLAENEKGLSNVRMSFFDSLAFWQDLKPGDFSLREWTKQTRDGSAPSLFIPHTKRTLPAIRTLIATWLDQIINEACEDGENRTRRVWIIIDELSSLGRIPALETGVTELRKTGFRVVCGIQTYEQIEMRYGSLSAVTITDNMSNKVIMRPNGAKTAERQSRLLGQTRVLTRTMSSSQTAGSQTREGSQSQSWSVQESVETAVLPAELLNLPDLVAYVRFAGEGVTHLTPVPIYGEQTA